MRRYKYGNEMLTWDALIQFMDDELREEVSHDYVDGGNIAFLLDYNVRHMRKHGELFSDIYKARGFDPVDYQAVKNAATSLAIRRDGKLGDWVAQLSVYTDDLNGYVHLSYYLTDGHLITASPVPADVERHEAVRRISEDLTLKINQYLAELSGEV